MFVKIHIMQKFSPLFFPLFFPFVFPGRLGDCLAETDGVGSVCFQEDWETLMLQEKSLWVPRLNSFFRKFLTDRSPSRRFASGRQAVVGGCAGRDEHRGGGDGAGAFVG